MDIKQLRDELFRSSTPQINRVLNYMEAEVKRSLKSSASVATCYFPLTNRSYNETVVERVVDTLRRAGCAIELEKKTLAFDLYGVSAMHALIVRIAI